MTRSSSNHDLLAVIIEDDQCVGYLVSRAARAQGIEATKHTGKVNWFIAITFSPDFNFQRQLVQNHTPIEFRTGERPRP